MDSGHFHIQAAVVAKIEFRSGGDLIELPFRPGQRCRQQGGGFAFGFGTGKFYPVGPAVSDGDIFLPIIRIDQVEERSLLESQDLVHLFEISLHPGLPGGLPGIGNEFQTHHRLPGVLGFDPIGRGHPQICRQTDPGAGQQMQVLPHPRIGKIQRPVGMDKNLRSHPGLEGKIHLFAGAEKGGMQAQVEAQLPPDGYFILYVGRTFISLDEGIVKQPRSIWTNRCESQTRCCCPH